MQTNRSAFTMIELLIVVAIIGLLAGLVLTGVAMLREQAQRVNCANNLRSWGLAVVSHSIDNRGNVPASHFQTNRWCPEILALDNRPAQRLRASNVYPKFNGYGDFSEFNVLTMAPYMDGGDAILAVLKQANGVASTTTSDATFQAKFNAWRCPSQRGGFGLIQASTAGDYADYIIGLGYAYFGRTDLWATMHSLNPGQWSNMGDPALLKQLGGRRPEAEQVLMNDLLYT